MDPFKVNLPVINTGVEYQMRKSVSKMIKKRDSALQRINIYNFALIGATRWITFDDSVPKKFYNGYL